MGSNFTISVSCHHFGWAFPTSGKSRIDECRPIAFKTRFFNFPHRGETKKHPWDRILQFRFHATILNGLFQAAEKAGLTNVVQLRSKRVFFNFVHRGETKKHPWDRILQFRFHATILGGLFQAAEKAGLTKLVQLRSKRVFSTFPIGGETKKHPSDRILQFRFHATILGGLYQAAEKAGFTKVDQLRSKRVFLTFPIGAKRENSLGIEFYNFGFMPPFWVGFTKQRKKPGSRRSSNCVQNAFFQLSPSGRNKKTPFGSNFTISVSCHHFGWAFPTSGNSRVDEGRPITFKTRFFNFPHRGETKKHPWDRILQFRFHATILPGFFEAAEEAGFTKVVQLRSKCVFSTFPCRGETKKHPWDRILQFRFHATILGGLFQAAEKAGLTNVVQLRSKRVFFNFVHRGETKKHPWDRILQFRFHATILGGLFQPAEIAGFTKVDQLRSKRVFSTFPIGAKRKNTLGIEFYNFGFMPPFCRGFSKQLKKPGLRRSSNCVQNAFFQLFPVGAKRKNTLGIEFYNSGFMPPFWVGFSKQRKKPDCRRSSNCVQHAFFQLSPSGRNEKTPLGSNFTISVSCHHFGWAFPSSGKSRIDEGRPIAFKTGFFNFPHRGERKKHPFDRILQFRFHATILGGLFQPAEIAGFTKVDQLRSKRVFSTFPIGAKRKNTLGIEFYNFGFMPPFCRGFSKQLKKPGLRRSSNCVQHAFFQLSPSGRNEKKPLGSNFTISVSCHYFGWAFPSSGKSRVHEGRPIAFKTRFFNFSHRGETRKHPWDRILQFRFHATILGGLFQAAEKTGFTKVVQLRSKRVFSTFPIGAKRKNTLGIEIYNFGFMAQFRVGFSKQRKKPDCRRSSNCVQHAFFQLSPSGRNEKTPLGSNFTISVSCHHFGWAFPSSGKSRIDEGRPIAFKTGFFNFPHRGERKKHPFDRILQFQFHPTILGGLFQAAEKAGWTKVDQLRSKRVFSIFPIGAKRKYTLGIEFYNFGFMAQFRVGFSKQRKKPD